MNTNELTGTALDWAVELAKGTSWSDKGYFVFKNPDGTTRAVSSRPEWCYSTDWSQGGPIMDREDIDSFVVKEAAFTESGAEVLRKIGWKAWISPSAYWMSKRFISEGETRLIAAMRCLVASKLGDEVEIPQEILTQS